MIRKWQPEDLAVVADALLRLHQKTTWLHDLSVDQEDLTKWLLGLYLNHQVTVFLSDDDQGHVLAILGVKIDHYYHPPHFAYMEEWCLWGNDTRDIVKLWREARQWGKDRGALFAKRGILDGYNEQVKWEKLR